LTGKKKYTRRGQSKYYKLWWHFGFACEKNGGGIFLLEIGVA